LTGQQASGLAGFSQRKAAIFQYCSLAEAVSLLRNGQTLALGGMTLYRRPLAFVRGLLLREPRPRDLTLLCFTAGLESDLLVGAGCVETVRSVYFGLESFGLAPMFSAAAQQGSIKVQEETELSIVSGMRATMAGTSYMPSRAWRGTDLPRLRPDGQAPPPAPCPLCTSRRRRGRAVPRQAPEGRGLVPAMGARLPHTMLNSVSSAPVILP